MTALPQGSRIIIVLLEPTVDLRSQTELSAHHRNRPSLPQQQTVDRCESRQGQAGMRQDSEA